MTSSFIQGTPVDALHPLTADELARACGVRVDWVVELVDIGIIESKVPSRVPTQWRFHGADLQRALVAARLERDFGANLDAAALIIDLQYEVRRLKTVLLVQGLDREL
ncbi:chaperone modulatory protein CbpM [Variovorax boronicumulans]|uniref:Chaperone modulatory protein CbpM n=1 Tax=Variovorax boronicumulans TaxID=436515 RepID=A0AAW8DT64_9BURK|nr:chaperone modulator CbpM [Variovorax boronicumulans]MDP9877294.1 chaperone modulatory protein CbpM [Variovorax boronicumulans]MDP9922580.1 chaperone modulatory protein CbpM [Variovorax boronicumulans]